MDTRKRRVRGRGGNDGEIQSAETLCFGMDNVPIQIKADHHRTTTDLAIVIPICRQFVGRWRMDFEALKTARAGHDTLGKGLHRVLNKLPGFWKVGSTQEYPH